MCVRVRRRLFTLRSHLPCSRSLCSVAGSRRELAPEGSGTWSESLIYAEFWCQNRARVFVCACLTGLGVDRFLRELAGFCARLELAELWAWVCSLACRRRCSLVWVAPVMRSNAASSFRCYFMGEAMMGLISPCSAPQDGCSGDDWVAVSQLGLSSHLVPGNKSC